MLHCVKLLIMKWVHPEYSEGLANLYMYMEAAGKS